MIRMTVRTEALGIGGTVDIFRHDDCGWDVILPSDKFCAGCGADLRPFFAALRFEKMKHDLRQS